MENIKSNIKKFYDLIECELILVIDSANENELNIFASSNLERRNIKTLTVNFGDPGSSRNLGLSYASGDWIAFIDSDDSTDFENFHSMVLNAESFGRDLCIGSYFLEAEESPMTYSKIELNPRKINKSIARSPGIWRMAFRSKIIRNIEFPKMRMGEDQVFLARMRFWNFNAYLHDEPVYTYRRNVKGQLTSDNSAIPDILMAQEETLVELMKPQSSEGSRILRIMFANQVITSLKRIGLKAFSSQFKLLLKFLRKVRKFRVTFLLLSAFITEGFHKVSGNMFMRERM